MWTALALQAGRHDPVSGLRHLREGPVTASPRSGLLSWKVRGRGRGAAGRAGDWAGGWGRRQDLLYLPSALSL